MATRVSECLILQYLDHFDDVSNCVDSCSERATREFEILRYFFVYFSHRSIRKACSSWSSKKKYFFTREKKISYINRENEYHRIYHTRKVYKLYMRWGSAVP